MNKTKLSEIADAIDLQGDEFSAYYNRDTGDIEQITAEVFTAIEDDDDLQEIKDMYGINDQEIEIAREILNNESWLPLPSRFDINEYRIMERFCNNQQDQHSRELLLTAISGKGASRRFKETAERVGELDNWYKFRDMEMKEIARQWCGENGVESE